MDDLAGTCQPDVFLGKLDRTAFEKVAALASDRDHRGLFAFVFFKKCLCRFDNVGVKRTGEAFIGTDQHDKIFVITTLVEQRMRDLARELSAQIAENLTHLARKRTRCRHTVLCSFELGRGDHFHRLGNLLCVFDRLNTSAHV